MLHNIMPKSGRRVLTLLTVALLLPLLTVSAVSPRSASRLSRSLSAAVDVVTNANDSGPGSLRDTIAQAGAGDTITFAPNLGAITLTSGELLITKTLTIQGAVGEAQAISGGGASRVLEVASAPGAVVSPTVTLVQLIITGGHAPDAAQASGAGSDGGGILNSGILVISNCTIMDNVAGAGGSTSRGGGNGGSGGGIANSGTLTITTSTITGNASGVGADGQYAGGYGGDGGGILNQGDATITNSTILTNTTGSGGSLTSTLPLAGNAGFGGLGGGIANMQGVLTIISSTISDNATGQGGNAPPCAPVCEPGSPMAGGGGNGAGLYTGYSLSDQGSVLIAGSTISGNANGQGGSGGFLDQSTFFGEGAGIMDDYLSGRLTVTNSTISGNVGSQGSGLFAVGGSTTSFSTIADNQAIGSASVAGGIFISRASDGGPILADTILADNTASYAPDCYGPALGSNGYNLIKDITQCPLTGDTTGNIIGQDPLLGPLTDNGGPTTTQALLPGSPAIDAVPLARCTVTTDQRGQARPDEPADGGACDIGAYESYLPVTLAVSPTMATPYMTVALSGTNFRGSEPVTMYWDSTGATPLVTATSTVSGEVGLTLTVPQAIAGPHTLIAVGQTSGLSATAGMQVTPLLLLRPRGGRAGSELISMGAGFGADEPVRLYWGKPRTLLGQTTTNAVGSFSGAAAVTSTVPLSVTLGVHEVFAIGRNSHAIGVGQFTVKP